MAGQEELTSEQLAAGNEVAGAAAAAALEEPTPAKARASAKRAARQTAQKVKIELTEEDANMIADALVVQMEQRGAFDPPPEQVAAPQEQPGGQVQSPDAAVPPQQPRKTSFAERFRSH